MLSFIGMNNCLFHHICPTLLFYNDTKYANRQRAIQKWLLLLQVGGEADLTAGCYLCSDYLSDLLGLDGDTISTSDFLNLIREDYRKQIAQEFRANSSIHKDFYEQTFPIHSKYGEVWLHTRLAFREKGTGVDGGDKSFGIIQRVEAP